MENNVTLIKNFYNAIKNKDPSLPGFCHEEIVWTVMDGMPGGGTYKGVQGVFADFFPKLLSHFDTFGAIPNEFIGANDKVIVFGKYRGVSKSEKEFEVPFCHYFTIQDNKISKFQQFADTHLIQKSL